MGFPDVNGMLVPIGTGAAISATATLLGPPIPLLVGGAGSTWRGEIGAALILDTTAITGDNSARYDIALFKGTVAAPVLVGFHRFITGADLAANVAQAMDIDGTAQSGSTTINEGAEFSATDVTLTVTSAASFPATGKYKIKVDQEVMYVTAGAGTTGWTVTRAQNATKATAHADGATVTMVITEEERRVTSGDQLHVVATKVSTGSNLSINFKVWVQICNNFLYAADAYPD